MTRKRARLTIKKSTRANKKARLAAEAYGTPASAKWDTMAELGMFRVPDPANPDGFAIFKTGDFAWILPHDADPCITPYGPEELWLGQIRNIRSGSEDGSDVWAQIQWFFTAEEVDQLRIKSFDTKYLGKRERVLGRAFDLVHADCFSDHASVVEIDERSLDTPPISSRAGTWYWRHKLQVSSKLIVPSQDSIATCSCNHPYIPGNDDIMHFCPRPNCRAWYHQNCLLAKLKYIPSLEDQQCSQRHAKLMSNWPGTNDVNDLAYTGSIEATPGVTEGHVEKPGLKNKHKVTKTKKGAKSRTPTLPDPRQFCDDDLINAASQPIVRGRSFGITGNVRAVAKARQLLYDAVFEGKSVPNNWREIVDVNSAVVKYYTHTKESEKPWPAFVCPECGSAI